MKIFGGRKGNRTVTCAQVVQSYGALIERVATKNEQIHSADILPYEKPLIEAALLEIACRGDSSVPVSTLKAGYLELASFQDRPGVAMDWTISSPSDRSEVASFFDRNGGNLAAHAEEVQFLATESVRRGLEWDQRLIFVRNANHA